MARICKTGFEMGHIGCFDIAAPGGGGAVSTSNTRGTWSTYCYAASNGTMGWDSSVGEFYGGFGFKRSGAVTHVMEYMSPNGTTNLEVALDAGQHVVVKRGRDGTIIGTGTTVIADATWYFLELYGLISDTVGKIQVRLNGVDEIALTTSLDTRNDAGANGDKCDRWRFADSSVTFDDVYVNDTTSTRNVSFSGDIRIEGFLPNAAGDITGLTPTSGSNYTNVDERPPNDATDIVSATGTTLYDLYNIPNTSGVASVQSVSLWLRAQKSDAGAKSIAHMLKYDTDASGTADTEATGSDIALGTTWAYYKKIYNDDPASTAWSAAKIDALQIGGKAR